MCGIAGAAGRAPGPRLDGVVRALELLRHRGPNDEGYAAFDLPRRTALPLGGADTDARLGLPRVESAGTAAFDAVLGHRRLSILDLSEAGHQPMASHDGRYWVVFNGEIYNYLELRSELEGLGTRFRTESDTEVLLAAYAQWGVQALSRFTGMYALALLDVVARKLTLARDPFGIKPLYYAETGDGIAFASEIPALLALTNGSRTVDPAALFAYLRFGFTDGRAETLFSGVHQVPAAHWLELDLGSAAPPVISRYWGLDLQRRQNMPFEEAATGLRDLFRDSVRLHLRSDVPLGCCLSGGLDSSAIVMTMRELLGPKADILTFSYIADDPVLSEGPYVDIVSQAARTISSIVSPAPEELARDLEQLITCQGEPFSSTSMYAQYRVFQLAKAGGVTVLLDGQGSDELFGGYPSAVSAQLASWLVQGRWRDAVELVQRAPFLAAGTRGRVALSAFGRLLGPSLAARAMGAVGEGLIPPWLERSWFEGHGVHPAPRLQGRGADSLREELAAFVEVLTLPQLLRYEDRNSMAFSLESRVPFCVPAMAEYAFALRPDHLVTPDGTQKAVLKAAMRGIVPQAVIDRPKVGFATPEQRWLQALTPWLQDAVRSEFARGLPFLVPGEVDRMLAAQLTSRRYLSPTLWRVVSVVHWMQQMRVASPQ